MLERDLFSKVSTAARLQEPDKLDAKEGKWGRKRDSADVHLCTSQHPEAHATGLMTILVSGYTAMTTYSLSELSFSAF